ncbi:MAG: hypothetical protein II208_00355 [Alphaproteobacteria bacterium]|jgi:hypothetical protein|nr:hypothetical protein [Alphaproteobacteria bacterium]
MEKKVINVTVADGGNKKTFAVRLFGAMEGLEFIDKFIQGVDKPSIKNSLSGLLPLASLIGPDEKPIDTMSVSKIDTYFQNPFAVLELAIAIFKHQMVFMEESEAFRPLMKDVLAMFDLPTSDSVTK